MGDAMGTCLEFSQQLINETTVALSMTMPGGGPHKVAPAQITDDGELTLSLMNGLIKGAGQLNLKEVVRQYGNWIQSKPFDIGSTIRNSFFKCDPLNPQPDRVIEAAKKTDSSESNGSLMRISSMAVWAHRLEDMNDFIIAIKLEVSLSHANQTIQEVGVIYCLAIRFALRCECSRPEAYVRCREFADNFSSGRVSEWFKLV